MSQLVFVYGTLRMGQANDHCMGDADLLGVDEQPGLSMVWVCSGFPAVYFDPDGSGVVGEVYRVSDEVFARLDRLEGYPRHYDRRLIETGWGEAWIYFYSKAAAEGLKPIPGGDWTCA